MNIYFDYDSSPNTANIVDKYLSRILTRIKTEITQLTFQINHNTNRPMPDGYILVKVFGIDGSVKVFGFDEQFRKEITKSLEQLAMSKIIHSGFEA